MANWPRGSSESKQTNRDYYFIEFCNGSNSLVFISSSSIFRVTWFICTFKPLTDKNYGDIFISLTEIFIILKFGFSLKVTCECDRDKEEIWQNNCLFSRNKNSNIFLIVFQIKVWRVKLWIMHTTLLNYYSNSFKERIKIITFTLYLFFSDPVSKSDGSSL